MSRFFLHLKQGARLVPDLEGSSHPSMEHAKAEANNSIREICADAIRSGTIPGIDAFVIVDQKGEQVAFLPVRSSHEPATKSVMKGSARLDEMISTLHCSLVRAQEQAMRAQRLRSEIRQNAHLCFAMINDIRTRISRL